MSVEVKVPTLPESVSQADLVSWLKKEGDAVSRDDNLVDIETDKVMIEIPAPVDGVLKKILRPDGATVQAGDVVAVIEEGAAVSSQPAPSAKAEAEKSAKTETEKTASPVASPAPAKPASQPVSVVTGDRSGSGEKTVMPAARKLLDEQAIDAKQVTGSGRGGRITKQDVLAAVATGVQSVKAARSEKRVPMTRLRQRIAERLLQSQASCAILTTFNEVNMKPIMDIRAKYKEEFTKQYGVRLGFMSFFVKAVVQALAAFPVVNASIDGTDVIYHDYFDIGIAVGSPRGLVVPIIRDADRCSLAEIERQIADYGEKAKTGRLSIEEMTGGTFTISNGGAFGSMMSTPIINPPQSAILGMHAIKERPVVEDGQIVIRPMNYLAVSYDHRLIDGREAVLFLVRIKELLEDPIRFLLAE